MHVPERGRWLARTRTAATLCLAMLLCACVTPTPAPPGPASTPPAPQEQPPSTAPAPDTPEGRAIAVLLREADEALAANRLTTPVDDNALDRFLHVLVLDPDEPRARLGIDEIARRYQRWAVRAAGNGDAARAEQMLDLATQVRPDDGGLEAARTEVRRALAAPAERHELARGALDARDAALGARLERLGTRAKEEGLFVIITSPVDAWSRWIYQRMNQAPPALRLRARSEVGDAPVVELRTLAE